LNPFWERNIISDVPKEEIPSRAIFMGNHLSYSDAWFTCGLLPTPSKIAVQGPVFDVPFIGEIIGQTGNIPVDFEKREDGKWGTARGAGDRVLARAKEYLDNNCPVAAMPEGSITFTGDVSPFKPGFFRLAVDTNTPIMPFAIWGNQEAWSVSRSKEGWSQPEKFMRSATVWIHLGAPMYPEGRTAEELSEAVRNRIIEMRDALPNYRGNDEHYNPEVRAY
jgi:1-acyl-sn-glycerol-3-phosphate acyltransferase